MNKRLAVGLGLIVVLFLVLARGHSSRRQVELAAAPKPTVTKTAAKKKKGDKGEKSEPPAAADRQRTEVEQRAQEIASLGFVPVPAAKSLTGGVDLEVEIVPKKQCMWGDLDVIQKQAKMAGSGARLIMTVEPLGKGEPLAVERLDPAELGKGTKRRLSLGRIDQLQPLGLYICLDGGRSSRCSDKTLTDMRQAYYAFQPRQDAKGNIATPTIPDQVYYFQTLAGMDGGVHVLGTTQPTDFQYGQIEKFYEKSGQQRFDARGVVERSKSANKAVFSVPATRGDKGLRVELPISDQSAPECKHLYKKPAQQQGVPKEPPQPPKDPSKPPPKMRAWTMPDKDMPKELLEHRRKAMQQQRGEP